MMYTLFKNVISGYEGFFVFFLLATKDPFSIDFWYLELLKTKSCIPAFYNFGNSFPS